MSMRERFEKWWLEHGNYQGFREASLSRVWVDLPDSEYSSVRVQYAWTIWQAASSETAEES